MCFKLSPAGHVTHLNIKTTTHEDVLTKDLSDARDETCERRIKFIAKPLSTWLILVQFGFDINCYNS